MLTAIAPAEGKPVENWQLAALGGLLDALHHRGRNPASLSSSSKPDVRAAVARIQQALAHARSIAENASVDEATRVAAIALLGRDAGQSDADLGLLKKFLAPQTPSRLQTAALAALGRTRSSRLPELLLADWSHHSPSVRNAATTDPKGTCERGNQNAGSAAESAGWSRTSATTPVDTVASG